jgi:hypothetical protein
MVRAYSTLGREEKRNVYRGLVEKPERKGQLGRHMCI